MQVTEFQNCCGINIITDFPYDYAGDPYTEQELDGIVSGIKRLEGTYCHCHLAALNKQQRAAAARLLAAGYVLVGDFQSSHGKARVELYAKGLMFNVPKKAVKRKKKARRVQRRRK